MAVTSAPLCVAGSALQRVCDSFSKHPNETYVPSSLCAQQLAQNVMQDFLGPSFDLTDIRQYGLDTADYPDPIIMPVRSDPEGILQGLVKNAPVDGFAKHARVVIINGDRVYDEFGRATGGWKARTS